MWQRVYNKVLVSTRALLDYWIIMAIRFILGTETSPGGEVVNASVCKTDMRGFDSRPGLTCYASSYTCPGGGIGRHVGLKLPCL